MSTLLHKKDAPKKLRVAVISVSSTRTIDDDKSGHWIRKEAQKEGHEVLVHKVVKDDRAMIREAVVAAVRDFNLHAVLITGGTGLSNTDVTIEAVKIFFRKELTSFGALFTQLSFEEIDSAAILSRAAAGIMGNTVIFCIPGSINACKLACTALIFPELGHIVKHLTDN